MNRTYQADFVDENGVIHLSRLEDLAEIAKYMHDLPVFHVNIRSSFAIIKDGVIIQAPDYKFSDFQQVIDALAMGFNEPSIYSSFLEGNFVDKQQFERARAAGAKTREEYEQKEKARQAKTRPAIPPESKKKREPARNERDDDDSDLDSDSDSSSASYSYTDYGDEDHRTANDDRSDSMNPNNDSHKASEDNRSNQLNPDNRGHSR